MANVKKSLNEIEEFGDRENSNNIRNKYKYSVKQKTRFLPQGWNDYRDEELRKDKKEEELEESER